MGLILGDGAVRPQTKLRAGAIRSELRLQRQNRSRDCTRLRIPIGDRQGLDAFRGQRRHFEIADISGNTDEIRPGIEIARARLQIGLHQAFGLYQPDLDERLGGPILERVDIVLAGKDRRVDPLEIMAFPLVVRCRLEVDLGIDPGLTTEPALGGAPVRPREIGVDLASILISLGGLTGLIVVALGQLLLIERQPLEISLIGFDRARAGVQHGAQMIRIQHGLERRRDRKRDPLLNVDHAALGPIDILRPKARAIGCTDQLHGDPDTPFLAPDRSLQDRRNVERPRDCRQILAARLGLRCRSAGRHAKIGNARQAVRNLFGQSIGEPALVPPRRKVVQRKDRDRFGVRLLRLVDRRCDIWPMHSDDPPDPGDGAQ